MSNIIKPAVGRKVWYWHDHKTPISVAPSMENPLGIPNLYPKSIDPLQAMDATVIYVWGDRMVNLDVTDHAGKRFVVTSVTLVQPGDPIPDSSHCKWMDYQVKQQAVSETIEQASKSINSALEGIMARDREDDLDACEQALADALDESGEDYSSSVVEAGGEKYLITVTRVSDDTSLVAHAITEKHIEARQEAGLEVVEMIDVGGPGGCRRLRGHWRAHLDLLR